jgi:hypothetical protein
MSLIGGADLGLLGLPTTFSYVASCGFVLHITRQDQDKTKETLPPSTVKRVPPLTFSPSLFACLQEHLLPSRGRRRPQPAPLVVQVPLSLDVIDWGEGLGVLALPTPLCSRLALWISYLFLFSPCPSSLLCYLLSLNTARSLLVFSFKGHFQTEMGLRPVHAALTAITALLKATQQAHALACARP